MASYWVAVPSTVYGVRRLWKCSCTRYRVRSTPYESTSVPFLVGVFGVGPLELCAQPVESRIDRRGVHSAAVEHAADLGIGAAVDRQLLQRRPMLGDLVEWHELVVDDGMDGEQSQLRNDAADDVARPYDHHSLEREGIITGEIVVGLRFED